MNATAIGLSSLTVGQRGLDLVGQNVANASTPGYHRQALQLASLVFDGVHGDGVEVQRVLRYADDVLQRGILTATSDTAAAGAQLGLEQQVESNVTAARLDQKVATLFDQITQLSAHPDDLTARRTVLNAAGDLATSLNQLVQSVTQLRAGALNSISQAVSDINQKAQQIASLNQQIATVESQGQNPNDLLDQRDQLIAGLASQIDVRIIPQDLGVVTVIAGNSPLVVGTQAESLTATTDTSGNSVIYGLDPNQPLTITGGALAGLIRERNQTLPDYLTKLDQLATGLIRNFDELQATGLGTTGPLTALVGNRTANSATLPLVQAGLAIPAQAGQLFLGVTQLSTGQRTLTPIAIDPATQSLQDVANAITAASSGQVQATVTATNTLQLQAAAGYAFDFAGRFPTVPDNLAMNGTSVPQVTGTFTGSANDTYTFQVVGTGTVGVTAGLSLEVRDGNNTLVNTLNIGQGYTPGTSLAVGNGVSVQLSAGTTNNGSFSVPVVAQPDTAGLLPALGLDTFFTGNDAATLAVNPALVSDPAGLSASRSGQPGDAQNLQRFAALQDKPLLAGGTRSFAQFLGDLSGQLGTDVQSLTAQRDTHQSLQTNLQQQEQSISGVDVNEEMVKLLDYQRMVQSGSKYLSVVNSALDSVMAIVQ